MSKLTSRGIKPPSTSLAFEMLRFLVRYEDFEVVEVTLAVVTPRTSQNLFQSGSTSLLAHGEGVSRGLSKVEKGRRGERELSRLATMMSGVPSASPESWQMMKFARPVRLQRHVRLDFT